MNYLRIILAIVLVNTAGIALRYFGLDTYFIFLGFRLHLACILPFLLFLDKDTADRLWDSLKHPRFKKKILPLLWIILSLAFVLLPLYLTHQIRPGDPDYFYEFGLSSVFDFPIYLIWNFPQLCMLFVVLSIIAGSSRVSFIRVFTGLLLLFGFEFIPLSGDFSPYGLAAFILPALTASFFITKLQNVYWFSFILFSSVWSAVLLFGSTSATVINIFFAREYSSWEGLFEAGRKYSLYVIPSFFFILFSVTAFYVMLNRKKIS